ncbi:uncharacterized protein MELLADRAFT_65136 [Melampsora larici-populina 98AG31]|uniref:Helicase-associated domain-containing protein n=1 Tax=Melampsora larici-populina (strain 98AG31 / pathotype 3-4-7) TaxID=747676 RepID=F4RU41_MELLP|nr:uncharacterized protein MELLADRAFT_65136 [Melampsora larici-populina 98AG31]EGG04110.1 hypothetical protein MELLADRAFT_65136 [Melampsora larici-populina 98AG31]
MLWWRQSSKANAASCRAISTFLRALLEYNTLKSFPPPPTVDEHTTLIQPTKETIMSDQRVFLPEPETVVSKEDRWANTKAMILADLQKYGVTRFTFDWTLQEGYEWNRIMTTFTLKHWLHAKQQGMFSKLSINPSHTTEVQLEGIIARWIRGRATEIRSGRNDPKKRRVVENNKKKRALFKYRRDSAKRHLDASWTELITDADCCSETEYEPDQIRYEKIGLVWRSEQYSAFLHSIDRLSFKYKAQLHGNRLAAQRFDQCRIPGSKYNHKAAVCCGLPQNCYDPVWFNSLDIDKRAKLKAHPPSELMNTLATQVKKKLNES